MPPTVSGGVCHTHQVCSWLNNTLKIAENFAIRQLHHAHMRLCIPGSLYSLVPSLGMPPVTKAYTSQRNLTWFTRPFSSWEGGVWGRDYRLSSCITLYYKLSRGLETSSLTALHPGPSPQLSSLAVLTRGKAWSVHRRHGAFLPVHARNHAAN